MTELSRQHRIIFLALLEFVLISRLLQVSKYLVLVKEIVFTLVMWKQDKVVGGLNFSNTWKFYFLSFFSRKGLLATQLSLWTLHQNMTFFFFFRWILSEGHCCLNIPPNFFPVSCLGFQSKRKKCSGCVLRQQLVLHMMKTLRPRALMFEAFL